MRQALRAAAMLLALFACVQPALAQSPVAMERAAVRDTDPAGASNGTESAVEALRSAGNTVFVVPPLQAVTAPAATAAPMTLKERIANVRKALAPMLAELPGLHHRAWEAMQKAGGGSVDWLWRGLAVGLLGLGVGIAAMLVARRLVEGGLAAASDPDVIEERTKRLARALSRLTSGLFSAGALAAAGLLAVVIAVPDRSPEQVTAFNLVGAAAVFVAARVMLLALLSPDAPAMRLLPFDDALASRLYRQVLWVVVIAIVSAGLCFWLANFPLVHTAHQLMLLGAVTAMMWLLAIIAIASRRAIAMSIHGQERTTRLRRIIAFVWLPLLLAYLGASWVLNLAVIALSVKFLVLPTLAPLIACAVGLYVTGALILLYDRYIRWSKDSTPWSRLFHNVAAAVGALAALVVLAQFFPLAHHTGVATETLAAIGAILIALWALWRSVEIWVAERLEIEEPSEEGGEHEDGMGHGTTRLATLLPIFRNIAMFLIVSVALMVVLASLGVNVGPLFAGAGVVGLAIGFGAQTLIRDMFSGAFFLFDDAFRRGEYVDVGGTMGAVERISVRSFQLRHNEGALHTIPFGEIKQLTNYSRDWVVMKLPMRLTYNTDVEKVRKLIKKLGQQMADDPEIGPLFMEPLKSQGVIHMEDSAMIVRVKFKTKPGNQFVLRRHVYHAIRALFEAEGITFAHREVTVRVAGDADDETKRKAALAASREVVSQEAPAAMVSDIG